MFLKDSCWSPGRQTADLFMNESTRSPLWESLMLRNNCKHVQISCFWFPLCHMTICRWPLSSSRTGLKCWIRNIAFSWQLQRNEIDEFNHRRVLFVFILALTVQSIEVFCLQRAWQSSILLLSVHYTKHCEDMSVRKMS